MANRLKKALLITKIIVIILYITKNKNNIKLTYSILQKCIYCYDELLNELLTAIRLVKHQANSESYFDAKIMLLIFVCAETSFPSKSLHHVEILL